MKKVSAVLLFVALLAPAAVHAVGLDGQDGFVKRIATYLGLKSAGPSSTSAGPATTTTGRSSLGRTPLGDTPGSCTCATRTGLVTGHLDPDGICRPNNDKSLLEQYQTP